MKLLSVLLSVVTLSLAQQEHQESYTCPANTSCFKLPATCKKDDCEYYMTVQENPTNPKQLLFDMQAKTDGWVAIGFSEDMLMGNDDVLMCDREERSGVTLDHSWNYGHTNTPSHVTLGYYPHKTGYTYINGIVRCQFIRDKIIAPGNINWVDMASNQYHFLFASGPNNQPGESSKHIKTPCASTNKVDLSSNHAIEACPPAADDDDVDDDASLTNGCFLLVLLASIVALVFKV